MKVANNIKEFRAEIDAALAAEGLLKCRVGDFTQKVWILPSEGDAIRFFHPHAFRRPWGFMLGGSVGVEIPALRDWLRQHKPGAAAGTLRSIFTSYYITNDPALREFASIIGDPVPANLWASLLHDRLARIPDSVSQLVNSYKSDSTLLGWLVNRISMPDWEFLIKWLDNPDPNMPVPGPIGTHV